MTMVMVLLGAPLAIGAVWALRAYILMRRTQRRRDVQVAERERIARELHDTLLQGWQGLMMILQSIAQRLPESASERAELLDALGRAEIVLKEGRDRIRDLRTEPDADLPAVLRQAGRRLWRDDSTMSLQIVGQPRDLQASTLVEVRAIAEEALLNARRHAHLTSVEVVLVYASTEFTLSVADDGQGFDLDLVGEGRFGLIGMRERAGNMGGDLTLITTPSTTVSVTVPASRAYRRLLESRTARWQRPNRADGASASPFDGSRGRA